MEIDKTTDGPDKAKQTTACPDKVKHEAFGPDMVEQAAAGHGQGKVKQTAGGPTTAQAGRCLLKKDVKQGSACGVIFLM